LYRPAAAREFGTRDPRDFLNLDETLSNAFVRFWTSVRSMLETKNESWWTKRFEAI